jgi:putative addiction module component (TIGR02574 family)
MSMSVDEIRRQLMALPYEERRELAYEILASISDEDLDENPAAVSAAWAEEIKRRIDDYDAGLVTAIPAEDMFARARALVRAIELERVQPT